MPAVTGRYVRVTVGGVIYQIYREVLEAGQDVLCMHTAGADTTRLVSAGSTILTVLFLVSIGVLAFVILHALPQRAW